MQVTEIWRYPIKSMMGERLPSGALDAGGLVSDRRWAVRDADTGAILSGKQVGVLMRCAASSPADDAEPSLVTLPDGTTVATSDPELDAVLSAALGRRVRLSPLAPAEELDQYRRLPSTSADPVGEIRDVLGLEDAEPLPDLSAFTAEQMEFSTPPGRYHDASPLMVMSTSALRSLRDELPESVIDVRRFRPTFVVDTGELTGYPELGWTPGRRLQVGTAVIELTIPCLRCVMVTRALDEVTPADRRILRPIVARLGQNFGRYARVVDPGVVAVGDTITWLD